MTSPSEVTGGDHSNGDGDDHHEARRSADSSLLLTHLKKKAKIECEKDDKALLPMEFVYCQNLISDDDKLLIHPPSLNDGDGKTRNDLTKLRQLMDAHGFRTSAIASPRPALSIYKDSCHLNFDDNGNNNNDVDVSNTNGRIFLATMLGLHPLQSKLEDLYLSTFKNIYCLWLFCKRLREACKGPIQNNVTFENMISNNEARCSSICTIQEANALSLSVPKLVSQLIHLAIEVEPRNRIEQLEHEYQRIALRNSTFSNALVTKFMNFHDCCIKDVFFKHCPQQPKYERITIYTYDSELDLRKPSHFMFMPCIKTAMDDGPKAVVNKMISSCWSYLLRHGYFITPAMKRMLQLELEKFFLSGIAQNLKVPLQLNAHFTPNYALSFYLFGKAGAGKSSFVRNFQPALEATIEEYVDPEILVRFVKQNLNKPIETLQLELDLRPNNNDLSVMSIIQGRRMTMTQTKPGLVVVDLEEMPNCVQGTNPNQLDVAQLISQRFAGRKGKFQSTEGSQHHQPRNSQNRGIGNDASLITLFTSNYELATPSAEALQRLKIFQNLCVVEIKAVSGQDRIDFALSYLQQCINDRTAVDAKTTNYQIHNLNIPLGDGDTRPLVRHLRMISFYICASLVHNDNKNKKRSSNTIATEIDITQEHGSSSCIVTVGNESTELRVGKMENLFPVTAQVFDARVRTAMDALQKRTEGKQQNDLPDLSIILDFWLAKTLAPAVVVSNDEGRIQELIRAVGLIDGIHVIPAVNADEYKMMKSLYDRNDTPNLRDDILKFGRGGEMFVATQLECPSKDAQLCVREIIEDNPSMTAFSTAKSALYKSGLLFAVYVNGDITPEVMSRASLII